MDIRFNFKKIGKLGGFLSLFRFSHFIWTNTCRQEFFLNVWLYTIIYCGDVVVIKKSLQIITGDKKKFISINKIRIRSKKKKKNYTFAMVEEKKMLPC